MRVKVRRFDVEVISGSALASFMKFKGESTRSLALKVGCSHGTIHNMIRENVRQVPDARATKIAEILGTPKEALFKPGVSIVTRDVPGYRKGKAA